MVMISKKIKKKAQEFVQYYKGIRFYNDSEEVIYVNLPANTKARTYLNLIFRLRAHYHKPIIVKFSVINLLVLTKWFWHLEYLYFKHPFKKIIVYKSFSHKKNTDFRISFHYKKVYSTHKKINEAIPYIMHPINYLGLETQILQKNIGIVMSGNFNQKIYDKQLINHHFKMINRWQLYQTVTRHPSCIQISGNELIKNLNSSLYADKLVLMQWQHNAIAIEKWRTYLSAAKFLFCAPGMTMPLCHHVIEALSMGVVPILNYQNWLNPSLTDQENCLVFASTNDVFSVINKALLMDDSTYQMMQKNVMAYYKAHYADYDFDSKAGSELILLNENHKDLM